MPRCKTEDVRSKIHVYRGLKFNNLSLPVLRLQISVELAGRETGAILGYVRQFTVAHDMGFGICLGKLFQEGTHGGFLGLGAGVVRAALGSQASFIDNTQRAVVVVLGVDALHILRKEGIDRTVALDVPMIRNLSETGKASIDQRLGAERTVAAVANTMDYQ